MQFIYNPLPGWPPLAWIARLTPGSDTVEVWHGGKVETQPNWFCEAVWNGDFSAGDFDLTDQIFGSGARIRDGKLTFVSSGSTVDRLNSITVNDSTYVSNSFACLMAQVNGSVDVTFGRYQQFFGTILKGINQYAPELSTSAGFARFTYFRNLIWDGRTLSEQGKVETATGFSRFEEYRDYLASAMEGLTKNAASAQRRFPFAMLGTISSGYDSACVAALACRAGLKQALSMSHSKTGKSDTGEPAAKVLGIEVTVVDRNAWREQDIPEAAFVSSDSKGEDIYWRGAQDLLAGKVLLTGFQGGKLWEKGSKLGRELQRADRSGLSLTEYRLRAGFIHAPLPFLGARRADEMAKITLSPEMAPWDVPGDYSKPIPRRIIEEAGVARGTFGVEKKAASVVFHSARNQFSPSTERDFRGWLHEHAGAFWRKGKIPPHVRDGMLAPFQWVARRGWVIYGRTRWLPASLQFIRRAARSVAEWGEKERLSWHLFPWALDRAKQVYIARRGAGELPQSPPAWRKTNESQQVSC